MCRVKKILIVCLCVVSSFVFALHSSVSYAVSTEAVRFYGSGQSYYDLSVNASGLTCTANCIWSMNNDSSNVVGINTLAIKAPNGTYQSDTLFRFDIILWRVGSNVSDHTVVNNIRVVNTSQFSLYDIGFEQLNANTSLISIYVKVINNNTTIYNDTMVAFESGLNGSFVFALNPTERMSGGNWYHYAIVDTTVDTQSIVNAINNQTHVDYTNQLNTINSGIGSINNNLNDVQDSIDQSNNDANDRYEDEKDTINDNGDNANGAWTDNANNLKFQSPTFLFNWFWSLGTTDQCVDISTLASLIHSNETQYCSWYPTNIRSIISPIINIFLVCFISGFIIKWLKKDGI